ncbi:MAG TPA: ABC transporter ATP-binding protein [Syntrophales bacterium]|nr:ABC transporter ATP-binding protein [Syntrophales bacterium]
MSAILETKNLSMNFGGLKALDRLNIDVLPGEITALIGPNGAGKTTLFNCITGIYSPTEGNIFITPPGERRKKITGLNINKVTESGVARTFQNIRLFPDMTVLENVMVGRHCRTKSGILGAIVRGRGTMAEEKSIVARSYEILQRMGLAGHVNLLARNLPYGAQRRLEIARALATEPFLLLLDEPAAGMNPQETKDLEALIINIRDEWKISVFLIEHDMRLVMGLSDSVYVIDYGEMIAKGTPQEIRRNPEVIKAYLGEDVSA